LIPGRAGNAVRLRALLEVAGVREHATHILSARVPIISLPVYLSPLSSTEPSSCTVKDSSPCPRSKVGQYGYLLRMSSPMTWRVLTPAPT
jgi:hypothetical protein